jgi:hypothetical protein
MNKARYRHDILLNAIDLEVRSKSMLWKDIKIEKDVLDLFCLCNIFEFNISIDICNVI